MTAPGIPNDYSLSTTCFGGRLPTIEDQIFAAVAMGFRKVELGLSDVVASMDGLGESQRETGVAIRSLVVGCRDGNHATELAAFRLGSLVASERERALNSVRRHVRMAQSWSCSTIIVRGGKIEDPKVRKQAADLQGRVARGAVDAQLAADVAAFGSRLQKACQRQVEHLCRALHTLALESPDVRIALEPGEDLDDLLCFDSMGWVLDDLAKQGIGYWHDVGRIHQRERVGLPGQAQWLDAYAARMIGVHLQDAAGEEVEMPIGSGEVDFKIVGEYLPKNAERVLEISAKHGRAEILASVQYLLDRGL